MIAPPDNGQRRTIPYDYRFRFALTGEPERVHRETIRVSVEGSFIAVAIGYGIIVRRDPVRFGPARVEDLEPDLNVLRAVATDAILRDPGVALPPAALLATSVSSIPAGRIGFSAPGTFGSNVVAAIPTPVPLTGTAPAATAPAVPAAPQPSSAAWPPTLSDFRMSWLANSLRRTLRELNPESLGVPRRGERRAADLVDVLGRGVRFNPEVLQRLRQLGEDAPLDVADLAEMFEEIPPDSFDVQFYYALSDEGTGRAFQSDPILSTAGLGIQNGDRPFRHFAVPITFEPGTVIRMDITEASLAAGELHVCLQGYRVLGGAGTPTDPRRSR